MDGSRAPPYSSSSSNPRRGKTTRWDEGDRGARGRRGSDRPYEDRRMPPSKVGKPIPRKSGPYKQSGGSLEVSKDDLGVVRVELPNVQQVTSIKFSPLQDKLLVGTSVGSIYIFSTSWRPLNVTCLSGFSLGNDPILGIAWPSPRLVGEACSIAYVGTWRGVSVLQFNKDKAVVHSIHGAHPSGATLTCIQALPNGLVAVGYNNGDMAVFDMRYVLMGFITPLPSEAMVAAVSGGAGGMMVTQPLLLRTFSSPIKCMSSCASILVVTGEKGETLFVDVSGLVGMVLALEAEGAGPAVIRERLKKTDCETAADLEVKRRTGGPYGGPREAGGEQEDANILGGVCLCFSPSLLQPIGVSRMCDPKQHVALLVTDIPGLALVAPEVFPRLVEESLTDSEKRGRAHERQQYGCYNWFRGGRNTAQADLRADGAAPTCVFSDNTHVYIGKEKGLISRVKNDKLMETNMIRTNTELRGDVYVSTGESIPLRYLSSTSTKKCVCWALCENVSQSPGVSTSELWFYVVDN